MPVPLTAFIKIHTNMTEYKGHLPIDPVPFANTPYWLPQPSPLMIENINLVFGFRRMTG